MSLSLCLGFGQTREYGKGQNNDKRSCFHGFRLWVTDLRVEVPKYVTGRLRPRGRSLNGHARRRTWETCGSKDIQRRGEFTTCMSTSFRKRHRITGRGELGKPAHRRRQIAVATRPPPE